LLGRPAEGVRGDGDEVGSGEREREKGMGAGERGPVGKGVGDDDWVPRVGSLDEGEK
jgi:hypothetical protein